MYLGSRSALSCMFSLLCVLARTFCKGDCLYFFDSKKVHKCQLHPRVAAEHPGSYNDEKLLNLRGCSEATPLPLLELRACL